LSETKDIVIPEWLSKEKEVGPHIRKWRKVVETDKAIKIELPNATEENFLGREVNKEVWLPKSQITWINDGGDER